MGDEVVAHRVMAVGEPRHLDLGADPVGRCHEQRLVVRLGVEREERAERPDRREDGGVERLAREALDPGLGFLGGVDVYTGLSVVHVGFAWRLYIAHRYGPGVPRRIMGLMSETRDDFKTLVASLETRRVLVEGALRRLWTPGESAQFASAVEDSLMAPAKRLRPILGLLVAEIFRTDPATILPRCLEMVHTSSLILDDLPSMDNARMRRGRPACHIVHGESTAILAAFALQNRAFEILAEGWAGGPDAATRSLFAADLSRAIGVGGMIAGQAVDLSSTGVDLDFATLEFIHSRKTGALFICSASLGTTLRASIAERQAVATYAKNLGLAFQVIDDLLDASGHASTTGKDGGQDERKTTFVSFAGVEGARTLADDLAQTARAAIEGLGPRAEPLRDLSHYVVARDR